jgi:uncharacterized alkaline shock family protein YloU
VSDYPAEPSTAPDRSGPFAPPPEDAPRPVGAPGPGPAPLGPVPSPVSGPGSVAAGTPGPNGPNGPAGAPAQNGPGGPNGPIGPQRLAPMVKGRIEVADEVVEKVAALAAIEVEGVADMGGDFARAIESVRERIGIGQKRGDQGVKARITGRDVAVDVVIMVMYGHVVMDVARNVQANVAVQTHRMLGLNVVEVNVTVDDVQLPEPVKPQPYEASPASDNGAYLSPADG